MSTTGLTQSQIDIREGVQKICAQFPDEYWAEKDSKGEYAGDLHPELAKAGYIGICMPQEYGGADLGISEAAIMMATIAESGAGIAGCQTVHANVYATIPLLKFCTRSQQARFLPPLISGEERTCFGVTEPDSGLDTLRLSTRAERVGAVYRVSGQKIWITNAQASSRMVLLARTSPLDSQAQSDSKSSSKGLTLLYADIARGKREGSVEVRPIEKMGGRSVDANQVFFDNFEVPVSDRVGDEGDGFKIILHGMKYVPSLPSSYHIHPLTQIQNSAERILLSAESLGLGYAALKRASSYASTRVVFGRPIGQNQGIQHPLARSWCELEAARALVLGVARRFDELVGVTSSSSSPSVQTKRKPTKEELIELGASCNAAKYVAAEAAFRACEQAVMTLGGMGYAKEYHVERYLRESFVPRIAPVSREMILNFIGQKVLGCTYYRIS
ncbi:acyl-CoA dehydrogenase NM domain-like protein [Rickenella mellea]|uniref:Acyl-CoA dehydrogenase NM domain-like protein n=1 Tax=Rickenella mellea TaxID=50990 RepID=A0A4Y7PJB8_9AGAM|nr:acyl-CoA dehydrogenase NM domain-like protein [Rickenella mellea]